MRLVLLAAISMVLADIVATLEVQAESRNRGQLAGLLDVVGWLVSITTTTTSVTALQGNNFGLKVAVVLAVSAANYAGTVVGTWLGKRWVKADPDATIEARLARVEAITRTPQSPPG